MLQFLDHFHEFGKHFVLGEQAIVSVSSIGGANPDYESYYC